MDGLSNSIQDILHDNERVTHEIAKSFVESEFEKYRVAQNRLFESDLTAFLRWRNPPRTLALHDCRMAS